MFLSFRLFPTQQDKQLVIVGQKTYLCKIHLRFHIITTLFSENLTLPDLSINFPRNPLGLSKVIKRFITCWSFPLTSYVTWRILLRNLQFIELARITLLKEE